MTTRSRRLAISTATLGGFLVLVAYGLPRVAPLMFFGAGEKTPLQQYTDIGEKLLHGVETEPLMFSVSGHMPAASALAAALFHHASPKAFLKWRAVLFILAALLVWALAGLLAPHPWSLLAPAYLILRPDALYGLTGYSHFFHTLLVLVAAGWMLRRAQSPSPARSLACGLAVGAALLFRSPLAFFPPLLAAEGWLRAERGRRRRRGLDALLLCLTPALMLAPWLWLNWSLHRQVIPFERGEANPNIVTGAMGMVYTWEGDWKWRDLVTEPLPDDRTFRLVLWSAGEIARHPVRYARAYLARLAYAASQHPELVVLGLAALWLNRRRREFQLLGLLLAYYVGIHCLMTVQEGYFAPIWPLLAALAAALPPALAGGREEPPIDGPMPRAVLTAGLAAALGLSAFAIRSVLTYGKLARERSPMSDAAWRQAAAANPQDAWIAFESGRRALLQGRIAEADASLSASTALKPDHWQRRVLAAWARMLSGSPDELIAMPVPPPGELTQARRGDLLIYQAHALSRLGRKAQARRKLLAALAEENPRFGGAEAPAQSMPALDREPGDEKLPFSAAEFVGRIRILLGSRPAAERLPLVDELVAERPDMAAFWSARAVLAVEAGRPEVAEESMRRLSKSARAADRAGLAGDLMRQADKEDLRHKLKDFLALREGKPPPRAAPAPTASTGPAPGLGECALCEVAKAALKAGNKPLALKALAAALKAERGLRQRHAIALLYQESGHHRAALAIFRGLAAERPRDAVYLKDLGLCEFLSGNKARAEENLVAALRLDPRSLAAALTLGSILTEAGSYDRARAVYDEALAYRRAPHEAELAQRLVKARASLPSAAGPVPRKKIP